jgi:hypothetical protein
MNCECAGLPDLFKLESRPRFASETNQIAVGNWVRLHQCGSCGQLWRIDEWDKYQSQFAVRVPSAETWEAFDASELQKQFLISSRGGLEDSECAWSGCFHPRVKGVAYCVDHLLRTGARE